MGGAVGANGADETGSGVLIGELEPQIVAIVPERRLPSIPTTGTAPSGERRLSGERRSLPSIPDTGAPAADDGDRRTSWEPFTESLAPLSHPPLPSNAEAADDASEYLEVTPAQPTIGLGAATLEVDQAGLAASHDALRFLPADQLLELLVRQLAMTSAATRRADALAKEKLAAEALLADARNDIAIMVAGDHKVSLSLSAPPGAAVAVGDRVLVTGAQQIEPLGIEPTPEFRPASLGHPAALAHQCAVLTAANAGRRQANEEMSLLLDEKEQYIFWVTERAKQLCPAVLDRGVAVLQGPPRRRSSVPAQSALLNLDSSVQESSLV